MKLSLIHAAAFVTLTAACSSEDRLRSAPEPRETPADETPAVAPPRQLVTGTALPTTPVNLLSDPGFALVGRQAGYGSFLAFYERNFGQLELGHTIDSRSPVGVRGAVALVKPRDATDEKSDAALILTSFLGGEGPFRAQIWVSKSNVAGAPLPFPTDGSAVTVSVTDANPNGRAFELSPVDSATRAIGGRTWVLLRGEVHEPLRRGGFFVIRTGTAGGHVHLAAPEVTTDEIVVGQAMASRAPALAAFAAKPRALTEAERDAIARYRAVPPRLVPAGDVPTPQLAF
jgi:hypothetical protein